MMARKTRDKRQNEKRPETVELWGTMAEPVLFFSFVNKFMATAEKRRQTVMFVEIKALSPVAMCAKV